MGIKRVTVDTHTLVWFLDKTLKAKRLSAKALEAIRESEKYGVIYVSAITLMEIMGAFTLPERKSSIKYTSFSLNKRW